MLKNIYYFNISLMLFIIMLISHNVCAESFINCPDMISVEEKPVYLPEDWSSYCDDDSHRLMGIGFFLGDPKNKEELAPEKETLKKSKLYSIWHFDRSTTENIWISCKYSQTSITLIRPLNSSFHTCTIVSDMTITFYGQPSIVSVKCEQKIRQ